MRAFPVRLPSGVRYWTVLDDSLAVVDEADAFLRHVRFGRDGSELTTRSYAGGIALFLRWCARTGRHWCAGVEHLGLFITWLRHAGPQASGVDAVAGGQVLSGPGAQPVRSARRVNGVLTAVRGFVAHAVSSGQAPAGLMALIYELADERDLPEQARGEDGRMTWRLRARHRLHEPEMTVDRASDEEIVALLRVCRSARDRLVVLLMVGAALRRGEPNPPLRGDVHLLPDSRVLGCEVVRATSACGAPGQPESARRRSPAASGWYRSISLSCRPSTVMSSSGWPVPRATESDFVLVNLFREPVGTPMRPDMVNELMTACCRRAGLDRVVMLHQLRHAFGSNLADAGSGVDEVAELLGHASVSSSQVYLHPDPARLREAIERVLSPRELAGGGR